MSVKKTPFGPALSTSVRAPKRADLVAEEVKRWIASRGMGAGDRLPKEAELQAIFSVSKGTIREALKSLEVQGLINVVTGPTGGARVGEVPFDKTFQLVQNYLYFKDVTVEDIYQLRRLLEPELAAGAVPHLTAAQFAALESSIAVCAPMPVRREDELVQRQEDLHFHDILAEANPNQLLRFVCQTVNHMLRCLVVLGGSKSSEHNRRLGETNVRAHQAILAAARRRDAEKVRKLMALHIAEAEGHVRKMHAELRKRLVLDSNMRMNVFPRKAMDH
jgi:DNA-binding FadR family transcriptional regulator